MTVPLSTYPILIWSSMYRNRLTEESFFAGNILGLPSSDCDVGEGGEEGVDSNRVSLMGNAVILESDGRFSFTFTSRKLRKYNGSNVYDDRT